MSVVERESVAPARSLQQRREALLKANGVRSHRAALKERVKRGHGSVLDVLESPGELVETMKAIDLLLAAPRVGRVKAAKLLAQARLSPSKTLGGMTDRQRSELMRVCRRYGSVGSQRG